MDADRDDKVGRLIAELAVPLCLADHDMDDREVAVARRFLGRRLAARGAVSQAIDMLTLSSPHTTPTSPMTSSRVSQNLCAFQDASVLEPAYYLCVRAVAADERVVDEELAVLKP